ncbi:hypothetical protein N657DRAFT_469003 [Parathielavia appendiculata]|uniref:F-box domain-containing protein n=1 Tax=Parathielavia appendiculata TaxID=2587402 RepID=A0AAN6TXL4_9PEZI|nr:hypothetical protein N657DRAFT_469003 [Parathielavia appendiculata]
MAPASVFQEEMDAAGQQQTPAVPGVRLQGLPVEILVEIMSNLDFESFDNMLLVSRRLNSVVEAHWSFLLCGIVEREFTPVQDFFDTLWGVNLPEMMTCSQLLTVCSTLNGFQPLLNFCRVIKRWEMEFPSLRFSILPLHSRSLSPNELCRLRQGLYIWWRYARSFHGPAVDVDNTSEARRTFLRRFSTTQLHEVNDMRQTIRSAVQQKICPSVTLVRGFRGKLATKEEAARIGWGELSENSDIVDTVMKLHPAILLHLLVYRHRYATRASMIRFIRLRHPGIEDGDVESFRETISDVLFERGLSLFWPFPRPGFPDTYGGVLDHADAESEELRAAYSTDGGTGVHDYPQWRREMDASREVRSAKLEPAL